MHQNSSPQTLNKKNMKESRQKNYNMAQISVKGSIQNAEQLKSPKNYKNKNPPQIFHTKNQQNQSLAVCTKHNQCQFQYRPKDPSNSQDSYFSIDSQFLNQETPVLIEIRPEIQLQARPEIDVLIATNIRMNKYKELYKKVQKEEQQKIKLQKLSKLNQSAKQALMKTKSKKQQPKNKWNHSIYGQVVNNNREQNIQKVQKVTIPQKQDIQVKAIHQNGSQKASLRIKQYKDKETLKQKQLQKKEQVQKRTKLDADKLLEIKQKITENANQIIRQKEKEAYELKKKKDQIKTKILELQKESLKNCKMSKQKPLSLVQGKQQDIQMGQSQYSTFQARQQGRKLIKKQKKKKNQQESQLVAQTSSRRFLKQKMSKTTGNFPNKNASKKGPQSQKQNMSLKQNQNEQQAKGDKFNRFYVWNVPINQEDYSLVAFKKRLQQQEQIKYGKKQQKSFKQQALEFLRQKANINYEAQRKKTRQEYLQQRIQQKKKQLLQEYNEKYLKLNQ